MNAPTELNHEEMLGIRLEVLRREHRDLDEAIHALEQTGRPDALTLRRLKKQKLFLKDLHALPVVRLARVVTVGEVEQVDVPVLRVVMLLPDIIA